MKRISAAVVLNRASRSHRATGETYARRIRTPMRRVVRPRLHVVVDQMVLRWCSDVR
jgi:hypothetical protein